jgi:hypothetical protein
MCLPSIISVADDARLEINPKTIGKKEVYAKCPFCLGDANHKGKYKLSLNNHYNVFKCWLCGEKGGVLEFEAKITGIPYDEVRAKYFGKMKNYHPAEMLSPMQLKQIGWDRLKRTQKDDFKAKKDKVLHDWKVFERDEKVKHFAMLLVIAHLDDNERQLELMIFLTKSCEKTGIKLLFSEIMDEFIKDVSERSEWTREAVEIARLAWLISKRDFDFEMQSVVMNVLTLFHLRNQNLNGKLNQKSS